MAMGAELLADELTGIMAVDELGITLLAAAELAEEIPTGRLEAMAELAELELTGTAVTVLLTAEATGGVMEEEEAGGGKRMD